MVETTGMGDLGDSCQSTADCHPAASPLGVFCCLEGAATCGDNLGECVEGCSDFSSGSVVGTMQNDLRQDNNECGTGLFAASSQMPQEECDECVGVNTAAPGAPPDLSTSCMAGEEQFSCTCMTQNGQTLTAFVSPGGCFF